MSNFNIREDLQSRPLTQKVEILWISGPTWHDAKKIASRLNLTEEAVLKLVASIKR